MRLSFDGMKSGTVTDEAVSDEEGQPPEKSFHKPRRPQGCLPKLWDIVMNRWWLLEIISMLISTLAMLGVVVTLFMFDGVALVDWTFPIQPNSMLSVFMTISKSALLLPISECISQSKWFQFHKAPQTLSKLQDFDEASRGPLGSAQLLFSPRTTGGIAWCGALLTIISLALDPFTQQVLTFPSRNVPLLQETAQVVMTQSLEKMTKSKTEGAILSSLYSPQQSPLNYTCTTSSCLWTKSVTSLGVCSSCRTLTSLITPVCSTKAGPLQPAPEEPWNFTTTTCNYTIAPKVSFLVYIQTLHLPAADGRPAEYANQFTQLKIFSPSMKRNLSSIFDLDARWLSTTVTWVTSYDKDQYPLPPLTIEDLNPELFLCGFYFCAQTYPSLEIANNTPLNATPVTTPLLQPLSPSTDGTLQPLMIDLPEGSGKAEILTLPPTPPPNPDPTPNPNTTIPAPFPLPYTTNPQRIPNHFLVSQQPLFSLQGLLSDIFTFTASSGNDKFSVFPEPDSGTQGLLFSGRDIRRTFQQVADTVTGEVMTAQGSTTVLGQAMVDEMYVRVQWVWMGLPVGVLVGVGGLLVVTVWKGGTGSVSRYGREGGEGMGGRLPVWKGSGLALVMLRLKGFEGGDMDGVRRGSLEEMTAFASGVEVRLEKDEGEGARGLRFSLVRVPESGC